MGDLDLKGLREVLAKMTPGPWRECGAQPDGRCACGLVWSIPADLIVADVKPVHCDGASASNGSDAVGIAAIVSAAPALLSRIEELEAQAAKTDEVLAATVAKWEEMERCAYNICAHCKEPFERGEAMSRHAQTCPRNPVVVRIKELEAGLREALALHKEDVGPLIARLRLLLTPEVPRDAANQGDH